MLKEAATYHLMAGQYETQINEALTWLQSQNPAQKMWQKDASFWTSNQASHDAIKDRLGWLDGPLFAEANLERLLQFSDRIHSEKYDLCVLLGMGGSSLAPEVLRNRFGSKSGHPEMVIVDTTDPRVVKNILEKTQGKKTLFILASKSGTTIESLTLYRYFFEKMNERYEGSAGQHWIAITDPGSFLSKEAEEKKFKEIFLNPADVGGRYSALTFFGLVPAAILGIDLKEFIHFSIDSHHEIKHCNDVTSQNAYVLGALIGKLATLGRDKMTLVMPEDKLTFGDWVEQLVAESTGKLNKGIVPVLESDLNGFYSNDRVFVITGFSGEQKRAIQQKSQTLSEAGHPIICLDSNDPQDMASQFFMWEIATAISGAFLDIDPFDQPNVQEAKDKTKAILNDLSDQVVPDIGPSSSSAEVADFWKSVEENDYINILAFVPGSPEVVNKLKTVANKIEEKYQKPVNIGIGPRYLHSTGQLHKGGANNGAFVFISAPPQNDEDVRVSDISYGFQQLFMSQAVGDWQALGGKGRRRIHLRMQDVSDKSFESLTDSI